jgi:hypothetical protein
MFIQFVSKSAMGGLTTGRQYIPVYDGGGKLSFVKIQSSSSSIKMAFRPVSWGRAGHHPFPIEIGGGGGKSNDFTSPVILSGVFSWFFIFWRSHAAARSRGAVATLLAERIDRQQRSVDMAGCVYAKSPRSGLFVEVAKPCG